MKPLAITTLVVALIGAVATAVAQPGNADRPGGTADRPGASAAAKPDRGQAEKAPRAKRLAEMRRRLLRERVGLSDDKADRVEAIVREGTDARRRARAELAAARAELQALFASDSDDQQAWAAALAKLKAARDTTEALRDEEYAALAQVLSPKEQAKLLRAMHRVQRHAQTQRGRAGKKPAAPPRDDRGRGKGLGPKHRH